MSIIIVAMKLPLIIFAIRHDDNSKNCQKQYIAPLIFCLFYDLINLFLQILQVLIATGANPELMYKILEEFLVTKRRCTPTLEYLHILILGEIN